MAAPTTNQNSQNLASIKIVYPRYVRQVLPAINLGEIMPIFVRRAPQQGTNAGLINIKGMVVNAELPEGVEQGERLFAKVTQAGDKVVFKLVDPPQLSRSQTTTAPKTLEAKIQNMLQQSVSSAMRTPATFALSPANAPLEANVLDALKELAKAPSSIPSLTDLVDPKTTFAQLLASAGGDLIVDLKETAKELQKLAQQYSQTPAQRIAANIRPELELLLEQLNSNENPQFLKELSNQLGKMVDILSSEAKDSKKLSRKERAVFREIATQLRQAGTEPAQIKEALTQVLNTLEQHGLSASNDKTSFNLKLSGELQNLANRFDQIAQTQETMTQLNPLMQTLGEPALVLFPFLFQGLVSHSEISIEPRGNRGQVDPDQENEEQEGGEESEPYQRIQVSVPLPSMGTVDVDIAHRSKEILVRLGVEKPEISKFLMEHLEHLGAILREQGFEYAELTTQVGRKKERLPQWSFGLNTSESIIA